MFSGKIIMKTAFINRYSLSWVSVFCAPFWHIKANHWYGKPSSIDSITDVRPSSKKKGHNNIPQLPLYHDIMPIIVESKLKFVLSIKNWIFVIWTEEKEGPIACYIYVLCNSVLPFVQGYGEIFWVKHQYSTICLPPILSYIAYCQRKKIPSHFGAAQLCCNNHIFKKHPFDCSPA